MFITKRLLIVAFPKGNYGAMNSCRGMASLLLERWSLLVSQPQMPRVEKHVLFDEAGDKVVAMVIAVVAP